MNKTLTALTAVPVLALGVAFAAPASADYDAARDASCQAIGGVYSVGTNASNDRCIVTTTSAGPAVVSGDATSHTLLTDVGEPYLSTQPVAVEQGEPETSTATTYGEWATTSTTGPLTCVAAGKSQVQKCTATVSTVDRRDVFTVTTTTTPQFDVFEVLQDRQPVTTTTQPTTVTTTTREVRFRFTNNSSAIANAQSDISTQSSEAGTPIVTSEAGAVSTVAIGTELVVGEPHVQVSEPVESGTETAEPTVTAVSCMVNPAKQTVRDNSCPAPA